MCGVNAVLRVPGIGAVAAFTVLALVWAAFAVWRPDLVWNPLRRLPAAVPASSAALRATTDFSYGSAPGMLTGTDGRLRSNVNYSPASLWMSLSVVASGARGPTGNRGRRRPQSHALYQWQAERPDAHERRQLAVA